MAVASQNTLSTTAEEIFPANSGVSFREVLNEDASIAVYIGTSTAVTAANGHKLAAGVPFGIDGAAAKQSWWAIGASGTPKVTLIEW